jgi:signal peptidase I
MDETKQSGATENAPRNWLARLFAPRLNQWFLPRLLLVALCAYGFFGYVCIPAVANGKSMEPTYPDGAVMFCWCPKAWFGTLRRGDVVMVRMAGPKIMLLKRIVAIAGETVAFEQGKLVVDGKVLDEPYIKTDCNWELPPRSVPSGHVYVVGDNRTMPQKQHVFGKTPRKRIVGSPLW